MQMDKPDFAQYPTHQTPLRNYPHNAVWDRAGKVRNGVRVHPSKAEAFKPQPIGRLSYIPKAWAQTMMVATKAAMPANSVMSSMIKRAMETSIG